MLTFFAWVAAFALSAALFYSYYQHGEQAVSTPVLWLSVFITLMLTWQLVVH